MGATLFIVGSITIIYIYIIYIATIYIYIHIYIYLSIFGPTSSIKGVGDPVSQGLPGLIPPKSSWFIIIFPTLLIVGDIWGRIKTHYTIFGEMKIHLPAMLGFTKLTSFWLIKFYIPNFYSLEISSTDWYMWIIFSIQLGMSSSQLTHILQRGRLNHQPDIVVSLRPEK